VVIRGFSFAEEPAWNAQITGGCPGGADPAASWKYRRAGLRHQGQTATAADTLEIDVPTRHQRNAKRAVMGDGHPAIVPYPLASHATRENFGSR
jgi:hypothetical protein